MECGFVREASPGVCACGAATGDHHASVIKVWQARLAHRARGHREQHALLRLLVETPAEAWLRTT